jgi:hypothetical protein
MTSTDRELLISALNDQVQNARTVADCKTAMANSTLWAIQGVADLNYIELDGVGKATLIKRIIADKFPPSWVNG